MVGRGHHHDAAPEVALGGGPHNVGFFDRAEGFVLEAQATVVWHREQVGPRFSAAYLSRAPVYQLASHKHDPPNLSGIQQVDGGRNPHTRVTAEHHRHICRFTGQWSA